MEVWSAVLSIAIALTLGAMSPGPSFLFVARTALGVSRKDALAAAVGMGLGGLFFSVVALLGLVVVLAAVPLLHLALKLLGGAYLAHLGWRIWRSAQQPVILKGETGARAPAQAWHALLQGLATQVSNPKTAIVYASVFASLLPQQVPGVVWVVLPVLVFLIETVWYSVVALALSAPLPRARYLASKAWVDRAAGAVMVGLGLKLIVVAREV